MVLRRNILMSSLVFTSLISCGKDSNINQVFKTSGESERLDVLLATGKIHFDQGRYDEAYDIAKKAHDRNPDNEEVALLLSYSALGQAGIDPFSIVKKIIIKTEDSKKTSTTSPTAGSSTTTLAENSGTSSSSSTAAASALSEFADFISLSEDDYKSMIKETEQSDAALFKSANIKLFVPQKIDDNADSPRNTVYTIQKLVEAIEVICPFVASTAKVEGYALHSCEASEGEVKLQSKSHFLWGLAHLIEAIAYNSIILKSYDDTATAKLAGTTSTKKTPIEKKVEILGSTKVDTSNITDYVNAVKEVSSNVSKVLDTSKGTMLYTVLADLTAVSKGFGAIAGLPTNISDKIEKAIKSIEEQAKKISDATGQASQAGDLTNQSKALQQQLNSKVTTKLKTSIETYTKAETADQAKVTELCTAYKGMIQQGIDTLPTGCK